MRDLLKVFDVLLCLGAERRSVPTTPKIRRASLSGTGPLHRPHRVADVTWLDPLQAGHCHSSADPLSAFLTMVRVRNMSE